MLKPMILLKICGTFRTLSHWGYLWYFSPSHSRLVPLYCCGGCNRQCLEILWLSRSLSMYIGPHQQIGHLLSRLRVRYHGQLLWGGRIRRSTTGLWCSSKNLWRSGSNLQSARIQIVHSPGNAVRWIDGGLRLSIWRLVQLGIGFVWSYVASQLLYTLETCPILLVTCFELLDHGTSHLLWKLCRDCHRHWLWTVDSLFAATLTKLQWISNGAGVSLSDCQGDCDSDDHCEGDLVCRKRSADDSTPIPGCMGNLLAIDEWYDDAGTDYCYDTTIPTTVPTTSPSAAPTIRMSTD